MQNHKNPRFFDGGFLKVPEIANDKFMRNQPFQCSSKRYWRPLVQILPYPNRFHGINVYCQDESTLLTVVIQPLVIRPPLRSLRALQGRLRKDLGDAMAQTESQSRAYGFNVIALKVLELHRPGGSKTSPSKTDAYELCVRCIWVVIERSRL